MARFRRGDIESAFADWWQVGNVREDWLAWTERYTPNVEYYDHFWGWFHGRDEVRKWIEPVMKGVPEIYTVLDWYRIDDDVVTFGSLNRRDNPDPDGPPYFDFPGLSIVVYAGDGLFCSEEDYWDLIGARDTAARYAAACEKVGVCDPRDRMSRRHWPTEPAWARTDEPPRPSWLRHEVEGVLRPSEVYAILGRERDRSRPASAPVLGDEARRERPRA